MGALLTTSAFLDVSSQHSVDVAATEACPLPVCRPPLHGEVPLLEQPPADQAFLLLLLLPLLLLLLVPLRSSCERHREPNGARNVHMKNDTSWHYMRALLHMKRQ